MAKLFPVLFLGSMGEVDSLKPEPTTDHTYLPRLQVTLAPVFDLLKSVAGVGLLGATCLFWIVECSQSNLGHVPRKQSGRTDENVSHPPAREAEIRDSASGCSTHRLVAHP